MKIAPILIDNKSKVDLETKFIVNDILPIAINNPSEEIPYHTILFCCHQDIRDLYMYLQVPLIFSKEDEVNIAKKKCFIDRIKENREAFKEYVNLTLNMRIENLFTTDLDYAAFPDKSYYKFQAIRRVGQGLYYRRELQITRLNWLLVQLFMDELMYDNYWNREKFTDKKYTNPKWIKVDHIVYDAATRVTYGGEPYIKNHYIIGCGPTEYSIQWISPDKYPDKILRKALDFKIYDLEYGNLPIVKELAYDSKSKVAYVLVDDPTKLIILKLEQDVIPQTNFVQLYDIVYEN